MPLECVATRLGIVEQKNIRSNAFFLFDVGEIGWMDWVPKGASAWRDRFNLGCVTKDGGQTINMSEKLSSLRLYSKESSRPSIQTGHSLHGSIALSPSFVLATSFDESVKEFRLPQTLSRLVTVRKMTEEGDKAAFVRRHYESLGYRVHSGLQFGCDFVLYADSPEAVHSDFCVYIVPDGKHRHFLLGWFECCELKGCLADFATIC
jgi:tRNA intron endonuclease, catalytic C-terminal domain